MRLDSLYNGIAPVQLILLQQKVRLLTTFWHLVPSRAEKGIILFSLRASRGVSKTFIRI